MEYQEKKKLFDNIISNKKFYDFLKFKVSTYISKNVLNDVVHDSILNFYKYHVKKFNADYYDDNNIFQGAKAYFCKRFFWYLSKNNYYGKKIRGDLKKEENNRRPFETSVSECTFYSLNFSKDAEGGVHVVSNKRVSGLPENVKNFLNSVNDILKKEDEIYLSQFRNFVEKVKINCVVKEKILKYLVTGKSSVFKTNSNYYLKVLRKLNERFNY